MIPRRSITTHDIAEIRRCAAAGMTVQQAAHRLRRGWGVIQRWAEREGVVFRSRGAGQPRHVPSPHEAEQAASRLRDLLAGLRC